MNIWRLPARSLLLFGIAATALGLGLQLIGPERLAELKFAIGGFLIGIAVRIFLDLAGQLRDGLKE